MSVESRCSRADCILINSVSLASVVQFGDNCKTELRSRALAVQRAVTDFEQDEARFASYGVFFRPELRLSGCTDVRFHSRSDGSSICVRSLYTLAVSASSLIRFGSGESHRAVARIKHIRQFNDNRDIR
ncbi:spore germination protein GerPE [Cohnella faecalis]|uniref:Spore germination protein GerPE n=1 Tax=Cohnella faecalis TaxID=2315694 RepID=A0A398CDP8_9BACL|nr:spore germination protein GerPE [Cohnella faecalis]RIE00760.1 spore germination protein GerPE [Cohnella faecalis]